MSIKTDGVVSGIATTALVKELSSAASRPKTLLESQISRLNTKQSAYTTLNTLLSSVKTSLTDIQTVSNFRSFSTSVPSAASSYFSATATGSAIAGTYSVQVTDTAKADMHILNAVSSSTATLNSGTLSITFGASSGLTDFTGTNAIQINSTEDNNTLAKLASALNAKTGITSYVLNTGATTNPYRLVVLSDKTGVDFNFSMNFTQATSSNLDFITGSTNTTSTSSGHYRVAGKDAAITINGISVSSSTNTFKNAVSGLTITALGDQDDAGVDAQDVSVTLDTTSISNKIQTFVNSYNAVMDFYNANTAYNATTGSKGIFVGDSNMRNIINQLRSTVSKQYTSLLDANGTQLNTSSDLNSLGTMGVTFVSSTGKLKYTSSKFVTALNSQQFDVEAMFSSTRDSSSNPTSFSATMEDLIKTYTLSGTGTLATLKTNTDTQIKNLQKQVTRWESRIKAFEARLFKQFTAMEKVASGAQTASSFLGTFFTPQTK